MDDIKTLTGKDEGEILETKYIYDLESSIFINNENKFVKYALPPSAQLSSIEDIKFLNNSNDLIYVGNNSKYVTELGFSSANPGGLLLDLDIQKMIFKKSKNLPLSFNKDYKEILVFDKSYLIFSNNNYIFSINENSIE